jgi:hypothetical protein
MALIHMRSRGQLRRLMMEDELELGYLRLKMNWIIRNTESAVPLANTLHDLLTGQIVGKRYGWDSSRKFIFRSDEYNETQNVANGDDFQPQPRIGLLYNEKFVWAIQQGNQRPGREML